MDARTPQPLGPGSLQSWSGSSSSSKFSSGGSRGKRLVATSMKPRRRGSENLLISKFTATRRERGAINHLVRQRSVGTRFRFGAMRPRIHVPAYWKQSPELSHSSQSCPLPTGVVSSYGGEPKMVHALPSGSYDEFLKVFIKILFFFLL